MFLIKEISLANYDFENSYCNNIRDSLRQNELKQIELWIEENYNNRCISDDELFFLFHDEFDELWENALDNTCIIENNRTYYVRNENILNYNDLYKWDDIATACKYKNINIEPVKDFFVDNESIDLFSVKEIILELENNDALLDIQCQILHELKELYQFNRKLFTECLEI